LHRVSLVLLDVVMPKLGGKEAHNRIMAMQPDLPVVFSSGYAANILDAEYLQEHGIRIIHKPYAPADLYRVLREVLDA
ncbi:MAG: response regulator, partial [Gammaproteobacteria bacterium]|nr:response regulator [Gammaproteobacteria bacterium]NIR97493.1 response regulator [Gammaproteobacteria bacterium]NIT63131.1 response regulator [Gammaproteobacteria bacterium]NIV20090.1 response regulator [Gammaproteobacteria bacterium]NIY31711.1 response regulator [Gammaproteobacteria bacterium]